MTLDPEEIRRRVEALGDWFHDMDLNGVRTAPNHFLYDYPKGKFARFAHALPDLRDRTVLDIGCNAGFYALEMKRRGAARVVAIDTDPRYLDQARLAAEVFGLEIEFRLMSVYQIARLRETFDLVIFMGLFYHLRHPLLALDLVRETVTNDLLLFQTLQRGKTSVFAVEQDYPFFSTDQFDEPDYPRMHFIEHRYAGDPTNWWAPNAAATQAMLRSSGFEILEHPEEEVYLCRASGSKPTARPSATRLAALLGEEDA